MTTCYACRVETGPYFVPGLPRVVAHSRRYVENIKEELTAPGEWFLDPKPDPPVLYYWPNRTTDGDLAPPDKVVLPLLESIVVVNGSKNVSFTGFEFTETRATYMEMYEVPSGGDWSVYGGFSLKIGAPTAMRSLRDGTGRLGYGRGVL